MKKIFVFVVMSILATAANSADVVGQRYIDQLARGGFISIKQAAQSMYNTGESNQEVLDVAAEVLLEKYPTAGHSEVDALAWLCRALGNSGNSRYYGVLNEVAEGNVHKKLKKYASSAMKEAGKSTENQYVKGTVDLAALRAVDANQAVAAATAPAAAQDGAEHGLDVIREGMSMQEVFALVGHPTNTTSHQTGKAFIPFNFRGKDLARTILLYKGKGRVICSHDGYSTVSRVLEVVIDPNESGFP